MSRIKGKNNMTVIFVVIMATILVLIAARGIAANLNQKNLALTSEVSQLVSTNQWIKYQISDKISLDKIETYARTKLNMTDVKNKDIRYVSVDLNYVNEIKQEEIEKPWHLKLQENVGEIFNGQ